MKYFNRAMSSNSGRLLWVFIIFIVLFFPVSYSYFISAFLSWLALNHLGNKLNLKHKKMWRVMAIPFGLITYLVFLTVKRKQLKSLSPESQDKTKTTIGLKSAYSFAIDGIQTFLFVGIFFFFAYLLAIRPSQVGTGMEPTIKKGSHVMSLLLPLRFINPERQDIIVSKNPINVEKNVISRIIGIPGDKIMIKDGYVYLNGKLLDEPYTLKPRSTWVYNNAIFGKNCEEITVPSNSYFLLGDNRGFSDFSIYIGFFSRDSIIGYVPRNLVRFLTYNPIDWNNHLRDTSHDKDLMGKSTIDVNKYVELINKKRIENGIPPLKYDKKVERSAELRLQNMIEYNDFSSEATKSGYTQGKSAADAGFNSGNVKEAIAEGYYDSSLLFETYMQPEYRKDLLDKNLQYIGVVSKIVNIDSCPKQIIVQHFLGQ